MPVDTHGLPISTDSEEAAQAYREGVRRMLAAWPGAEDFLDQAIAADPAFALAHIARGRMHAMSAQPVEMRQRIASAQALVAARGDERERSHVEAAALALSGRSDAALRAALAHADSWPRDVLVLSLPLGAFGLFAFSGMADHDQARVDLCARHAASFAADDWWFLTSSGWAFAENGEVARGRAMIERAFELRRENANTVHALAHAMFEGGAGEEARALIAGWLPGYDPSGVLHGHIAWHAALVALEHADVDAALDIYQSQVRPGASSGMAINIVSDAASLLWRMEAYGRPASPAHWMEIADFAANAFPRAGHAFIDAHMALIEAASGDSAALGRRISALDDMIAKDALGAGPVVPAIARAAQAFADDDYASCVAILEPVAGEVVRIGGSGAQREVIEDTLIVALMRAGEADKARNLVDRRLHRRPSPRDARWRAELLA